MKPRIGSLFSGGGGLDLAVEEITGGAVAWHVENDKAASKVLAARWPGVPNLGDVTAVDWAGVEPVDVICGGSPCQDVSHAGKRAGMRAGTRSGLWAAMCDAVDALRPQLVVWENVRGVLSAEADSAMEPCPGCVGDGDDGPVLRALGRVLGDLADLGYDARWTGLRAADVGAPHGRFRIFVVAYDTRHGGGRTSRDSDHQTRSAAAAFGSGHRPTTDACVGPFAGPATARDGLPVAAERGAIATADTIGHERGQPTRPGRDGSADGGGPTAHPAGNGWHEGRPESTRLIGGPDAAVSRASTTDAEGTERRGTQPEHLGTRPVATAEPRECAGAAPDAERVGRDRRPPDEGRETLERAAAAGSGAVAWGDYESAVRRWEYVTGRVAPAPTEPATRGGQRLSPRFVEWMMGWPAGWVTDVPGVTRNDALRILGNGVVPQQAVAALEWLLSAEVRAA